MKKAGLLKVILTVTIALTSLSGIYAKNYYVSNSGNDGANGTSSSTPWKTISKVNSTTLSAGDTVFFFAGGSWRETLELRYSGNSGNRIVYTRYGEGKNPEILGSEKAVDWTSTGTTNVWKTATSLENLADEYYPGGLFFIEDDSVTWGNHKNYNSSFSNLTEQYDFCVNGSVHYVYSTKDPDEYQAIEVTQRDECIAAFDNSPVSYLVFQGINFRFSRLSGFYAGYPAIRGATDLTFRSCKIGYIGERASGYAYGIAAWHSNFLVEFCQISDCGRRGISINLYLDQEYPENRVLKNIIIRKNFFKRGFHTTALDLSSQLTSNDTITGVYFYGNIVDDSEHKEAPNEWISNQVFTQAGASYINDVYIYNNILLHATGRNILIEDGDSIHIWNNTIIGHNPNIQFNPYANVSLSWPYQVDFRNNILYDDLPDNSIQNHGVLMYYEPSKFMAKDNNLYYTKYPKTDRNFAAHRADNNLSADVWYYNTTEWNEYLTDNPNFEQNSPAPADPQFMKFYSDLRLKENSPAKGKGAKIDMIKNDFTGNPVNNPPDIGAIRYGADKYTGVLEEKVIRDLQIRIWPNPTSQIVNIDLSDGFLARNLTVRMYNLEGKLVYSSGNYSGTHLYFELPSNLQSGLYFLNVSNGFSSKSGKILVRK